MPAKRATASPAGRYGEHQTRRHIVVGGGSSPHRCPPLRRGAARGRCVVPFAQDWARGEYKEGFVK